MPWHSFQPELCHLSFSVIATKRRNETIKPKATQFNLRLRDILRLFKSIPSMTASDTKVIEEFFSVATKVAHFEWRPSPRKESSISKYAMENQRTPHSWMLTWSTKYTYFPLDRMLVHSRLLPEFRQFSKYFADSLLHSALRKIQSNLNVNDCIHCLSRATTSRAKSYQQGPLPVLYFALEASLEVTLVPVSSFQPQLLFPSYARPLVAPCLDPYED